MHGDVVRFEANGSQLRVYKNGSLAMSATDSTWSDGSAGVGFYALPEKNACVWIEFEHGDPDYPIWTGGFWGRRDDVPEEAQQQPTRRVELRTSAGHRVVLDERDGITLEASGGQKIVVGANGIEISDGKGGAVKIDGGRVNVNDGALEVT